MKKQLEEMESKVKDLMNDIEALQLDLENKEDVDWELLSGLNQIFPELNNLKQKLFERTF